MPAGAIIATFSPSSLFLSFPEKQAEIPTIYTSIIKMYTINIIEGKDKRWKR